MEPSEGEQLGTAALALVGAPFRMHGRDPATGLDCVGVAVAGLAAIGRAVSPPADYRLRGGCMVRFDRWASACGLVHAPSLALGAIGDVLLCIVGPQQFHVMIDTGAVLVHAHAGLRKVTAIPGPSPWPIVRRWRLQEMR